MKELDLNSFQAITTPAGNPPAGFYYVYPKSDNVLYLKSSAGVEYAIGSGGEKSRDKSATNGATLSSTSRTFLSSSGREFLAHSGTGSSTDACGFMYLLQDWVSGCKVQVICTTADDGTKYFVYKAQITIWDGETKTQEEITLPKVLTAGTGSSVYPQLKTTEAEFSQTVRDAMGNGKNISIKITRDAGHADDNYNSSVYTEYCRLIYNY